MDALPLAYSDQVTYAPSAPSRTASKYGGAPAAKSSSPQPGSEVPSLSSACAWMPATLLGGSRYDQKTKTPLSRNGIAVYCMTLPGKKERRVPSGSQAARAETKERA